jgi:hypothetical protein
VSKAIDANALGRYDSIAIAATPMNDTAAPAV